MVAKLNSGHRSGEGSEVVCVEVEDCSVLEGEGEVVVESFHEEALEGRRHIADALEGVVMVQDHEISRVDNRVES